MRFWRAYLITSVLCFVLITVSAHAADAGLGMWLAAVLTYWASQFWFFLAAYRDFLRDTDGRR